MPMAIITLDPTRWKELRELRLTALQTDPSAFASNYQDEVKYADERWINWLQEAQKGENVTLLFAECDNKLIGMVGALIFKESRSASIIAMYVAVRDREKGVGKALIQAICKKLEGYDFIKEINLKVNTENSAAISCYEKQGFVKIDTIPVQGKFFKTEYLMTKKIT